MHKIDIHECIDCGFCASICPKDAISERKDFAYEIDDHCINWTLCAKNCPVNTITRQIKKMKSQEPI